MLCIFFAKTVLLRTYFSNAARILLNCTIILSARIIIFLSTA